jgi:CRP/FNR family transcriptional regulator, cyclic AMP receptor protein
MQLGRASERVKALRSIPLLRDLDRSDLAQVAKMSYSVTREPGDVLLRQGDVGTELLLIVEGRARVERDGQVVGEVGPNAVIGEMALLDSHRRSASVVAETSCELLVVPYDQFWNFIERVPSVQRKLLITLSRRVRDLEQVIAE